MWDLVIKNAAVVDGTGQRPATFADVAIEGDRIAEVTQPGQAGRGHRELDGTGLVLAPGWVDIHTHYDAQVAWDAELSPSGWHGVTTVIMGNCGVGFAPVHSDGRDFLIEVMEGVEDIPAASLRAGLSWEWESLPEYLRFVDSAPKVLDVGVQVPHAALRAYVMGERAHQEFASADDIAHMAQLTEEGLRAGALGFTTNRLLGHRSVHGPIPGTFAHPEELFALADALGRVGNRAFLLAGGTPSIPGADVRAADVQELARRANGTLVIIVAQTSDAPEAWREALQFVDESASIGLNVVAQVKSRPTGFLFGLRSGVHPFIAKPLWHQSLAPLNHAERVARLRDPQVRSQLLSEPDLPLDTGPIQSRHLTLWPGMYALGDPPDYEPHPDTSIESRARREGRSPAEVALDVLLEHDGNGWLYLPVTGYVNGNQDAIREMMLHPRALMGLADGGAHVRLTCDASTPTSLLTFWVRDRSRGPRIPLEQAVSLLTSKPAHTYGLSDRGVIAPGMRADLNLIDLSHLELNGPTAADDLPGGGTRIVQRAQGYEATIAAGKVTYEHGEPTGERPGRLAVVA
jgi:N-acyl-D-amino-acid deacylase